MFTVNMMTSVAVKKESQYRNIEIAKIVYLFSTTLVIIIKSRNSSV